VALGAALCPPGMLPVAATAHSATRHRPQCSSFRPTWPLALMGLACGFAMHYLIEGGSIRDLVDEAAKQAQQLA